MAEKVKIERIKGGPCKRTRRGLRLCPAMALACVDWTKDVGMMVAQAVNFKTGKLTEYPGVRRSRKEKLLLFNVCPFCRFEYAVKQPAQATDTEASIKAAELAKTIAEAVERGRKRVPLQESGADAPGAGKP